MGHPKAEHTGASPTVTTLLALPALEPNMSGLLILFCPLALLLLLLAVNIEPQATWAPPIMG